MELFQVFINDLDELDVEFGYARHTNKTVDGSKPEEKVTVLTDTTSCKRLDQ